MTPPHSPFWARMGIVTTYRTIFSLVEIALGVKDHRLVLINYSINYWHPDRSATYKSYLHFFVLQIFLATFNIVGVIIAAHLFISHYCISDYILVPQIFVGKASYPQLFIREAYPEFSPTSYPWA